MRPHKLFAGIAALAWMLLAQPALAATVGVFEDSIDDFYEDIRYQAAVGELNAVTVLEEPAGTYTITDLGAVITTLTPECVSLTPNSVRCQVDPDIEGNDERAWFFLEDGADTADVGDSYGSFVRGGAGPDTLTGSDYQILVGGLGDDTLVGGGGGQELFGGNGSDSLDGGAGRDDYLQGGAGTDVIAGGPGEDEVSYSDHPGAVRISLDGRANDGAAGENDWVRADVENATGSRGRTTFIGNASPNEFWGRSHEGNVARMGAGNDLVIASPAFGSRQGPNVLSGGAGNDLLAGGSKRDIVLGGPGDDWLSAYGSADVIRGGPGTDSLYGRSGADDLIGGRGNDRVRGGLGHDMLRGGPGRDHLIGDSGADVFYARDRNRDRVDGGAGPDRAQVDSIDRLFGVEVLF
jgi:Ca2+-binding RTX toxin-like protein